MGLSTHETIIYSLIRHIPQVLVCLRNTMASQHHIYGVILIASTLNNGCETVIFASVVRYDNNDNDDIVIQLRDNFYKSPSVKFKSLY